MSECCMISAIGAAVQWRETQAADAVTSDTFCCCQAPAPPQHLTFLRITPVFGAVLENWELWP